MSFRLTAVLLAVLALLGGAVWYFELRNPPEPATKSAQNQLLNLQSEQIARLEVVDAGKSTVVERTADGEWKIVAPPTDEADSRRIEDTVSRIANLNATRKLENADDPASYGLATPTARVELTTNDGQTRELLIGARTPDNSSYYVKRGDAGTIYVVPTFAISELTRWTTDPPKPRPTPPPLPTPAPKP